MPMLDVISERVNVKNKICRYRCNRS